MTYAILMIRGLITTKRNIKTTLEMLHLTRQNHLVLVPSGVTQKGMLGLIKDYVTWGEPDAEMLAKVIAVRGRLIGDKPITDEYMKANSSYATIRDFAAAVAAGKARYADLKDVKPVIRLHPPKGGYEKTKRAYKVGGSLGNRGKTIGTLLLRMLGPEGQPAKAATTKGPAKAPPPAGGKKNG